MLERVSRQYCDVIDFDSVHAELHGDLAITYRRCVAHTTTVLDADRAWFPVCFERFYAKREGRWIYLSNRTVHGPTFGPGRQSVRDN
jgi:hypothetical protein